MKYLQAHYPLLAFQLLCISCDEKPPVEPCERCETTTESEFNDSYFRLLLNEAMEPILVRYDTGEISFTLFRMCSNEIVDRIYDEVEFTKIIRATGYYKKSCQDTSETLIEPNEYNIIQTCLPEVPNIDGTYSLFNTWYVYSIQNADTILHPPCEGQSYINFDLNTPNIFSGMLSLNSISGDVTIEGDSTLKLYEQVISLMAGTEEQIAFEALFMQVFDRNATLAYSIEDNFLTLVNISNDQSIKLYIIP